MSRVEVAGPLPSAPGRVYAGLKSGLMTGKYHPGERLVVRILAEHFATSPMPVREALHRLVSEEALVELSHRGVAVPEVSAETILDLVRVRSSVEGAATEWAATTMTERELAELEAINERMHAIAESGSTADYLSLNRDFHFTIYRASRSRAMQPIIERLWLRVGPWLNLIREGATLGVGLDHHAEMLDAFRRGDGVRARRALIADIGDAADVMLRSLNPIAAASRPGRDPARLRSAGSRTATRRVNLARVKQA